VSPDPTDRAADRTGGPDLAQLQRAMARSVLGVHPAQTGAADAIVDDAIPALSRLAIYRNNTMVSLTTVLARAYPAVARHLGGEAFKAAARGFIQARPPRLPQLSAYGDGFADWLDRTAAPAAAGWAGDLARLEWAAHRALFAPEAPPLDPSALGTLPAERYGEIVFDLHPSLAVVRSLWPIEDLWRAEGPLEAPPVPRETPASVLVLRARYVVTVETLGSGDAALLAAVGDGAALAEAAVRAAEAAPDLDLQRLLFAHLTRGSFGAARLPGVDPAEIQA